MMATAGRNPGHAKDRCDNAPEVMRGSTQADVPSSTRAADRFAADTDRTPNENAPPMMDDDAYWAPFPDTLATGDAAKILSVGRPAVLAKLKNGVIPGHLIVGSWIIFKAELRASIEATSNQPPTGPQAEVDVLSGYADELTYQDLMTLLGKSKRTIYTWLNIGEIPGFHVGSRWIIHKEQLRQKLHATSNQISPEES
jgi:excisionase family DNA binding protein